MGGGEAGGRRERARFCFEAIVFMVDRSGRPAGAFAPSKSRQRRGFGARYSPGAWDHHTEARQPYCT